MAMLKTLARKVGGCKQIKNYLERDGRAVTFDCSPDVTREDWASQFDEYRKMHHANKGRKYYHVIISPDPKDGLETQDVRELAYAWVTSRHPDSTWIIETHEDSGVPHAHVVINSVELSSGRKLQLSNKDIDDDAMELQKLCKERGLSAFDNYAFSRSEDGEWKSQGKVRSDRPEPSARRAISQARRSRRGKQKWMRARGVHLWTDDMREAVERALLGCCTWRAFERAMKEQGYEARVSRRGVLTIYPPKGKGHPCKGYRLDESYTVAGIRERLRPNLGSMLAAGTVPNVPCARVAKPPRYTEIIETQAHRTYGSRSDFAKLAASMDAVAIMKANGYANISQLAIAAQRIKSEADELNAQLDDARLAYEHMEQAAAKVMEKEVLEKRIGPPPTNPFSESRWRKRNGAEISEIDAIGTWLEEHGLQRDVSLQEVQETRGSLYRSLSQIGDRATDLAEDAEKWQAAARAVGALPTIVHEGRTVRRQELFAPPTKPLRTLMTASEWTAYAEGELARNRARAVALMGQLDKQLPPEKQTRADQKAKDAGKSMKAPTHRDVSSETDAQASRSQIAEIERLQSSGALPAYYAGKPTHELTAREAADIIAAYNRRVERREDGRNAESLREGNRANDRLQRASAQVQRLNESTGPRV